MGEAGGGGGAVSWEPTWSDAARALFELAGDTAVSAGAGSGKTTALVELCVRLLSGEATGTPLDPGEVAAITFTEKAAAELVERLRAAVARRARAAAGGPEAAAWTERLRGLDRMAVGTIHNFCGRLLRERALEAGLDPEFTVLDESAAPPLLDEAARGAVVAALDAGRPEAHALCAGFGAGELSRWSRRWWASARSAGCAAPQPVADGSPEAVEAARAGAAGGRGRGGGGARRGADGHRDGAGGAGGPGAGGHRGRGPAGAADAGRPWRGWWRSARRPARGRAARGWSGSRPAARR